MNRVILIGRIVADPDVRVNDGGMTIAKYRLAVDRQFKKDGEPNADFLNCVVFGKSADFARNYLAKGMKIAVEGRIQTGSYTNKDGNKVYTTDIVVEHQEFCERKSGEKTNSDQIAPNNDDNYMNVEDDEDLPFN